MCTQRRLGSAWASAQSYQSLLSAWRKLGSLATHWAHSEDWSDWADAQADLSLHWAYMPFCWFCHEAAHFCDVEAKTMGTILFSNKKKKKTSLSSVTQLWQKLWKCYYIQYLHFCLCVAEHTDQLPMELSWDWNHWKSRQRSYMYSVGWTCSHLVDSPCKYVSFSNSGMSS